MQIASQRVFKSGDKSPHSKRSARAGTMAAIILTWKKLNPDLEAHELRDARLAFITEELGLRVPLQSMRRLKDSQLGRVIDALREIERAPSLPGVSSPFGRGIRGEGLSGAVSPQPNPLPGGEGEIHHLATAAQVEAIDKLFAYLGWSAEGFEKFLEGKFQRKSHRTLTPAQGNSCTMILFNIAASRDIRARGFEHATRAMIGREIPRLKRELGIDQKKSTTEDTEEEQ